MGVRRPDWLANRKIGIKQPFGAVNPRAAVYNNSARELSNPRFSAAVSLNDARGAGFLECLYNPRVNVFPFLTMYYSWSILPRKSRFSNVESSNLRFH